LRKQSILVIDDDTLARKQVAAIIKDRLGTQNIFEARDGEEALNTLTSDKVDIIITKWDIPKISGEDLLRKVRGNISWKDIPFVVIAEEGDYDSVTNAIQQGASQFIFDPFSPEELEGRIVKAWNIKTKRRAKRHHSIPKHELTVWVNNEPVHAKMLNVSRTGMLIKLDKMEGFKLFDNYSMSIRIDDMSNLEWLRNQLSGKAIRFEAEDFQSGKNCLIAIDFTAGK